MKGLYFSTKLIIISKIVTTTYTFHIPRIISVAKSEFLTQTSTFTKETYDALIATISKSQYNDLLIEFKAYSLPSEFKYSGTR